MNDGYIKIPRSLLNDPIWKSLPFTYRHIYLTILQHMAFEACKQNDFGLLTELQPGQFLTTERKLVDLCDEEEIDKSLIHRALIKFRSLGFSNHKTNRKKTIITITRTDILELLKPRIEPNSNQTRTIKEESEAIAIAFSLEKEASKKKKPHAKRSPPVRNKKVNQEDIDVLVNYCCDNRISISENDFRQWLREWDSKYIVDHLLLMMQRGASDPARWMQSALKKDYVGEEKRIENNKKFAEQAKFQYGLVDLTVTEKYCRFEMTGKDFMFDMKENVFQELLTNEFKLQQGVM